MQRSNLTSEILLQRFLCIDGVNAETHHLTQRVLHK
jgi:hypothetical protein